MRYAVFLLAFTCGALSAPREEEFAQEIDDDSLEDALDHFIVGNHIFSSNVYQELIKYKNGSFVYSPFSAETTLALTHEGARGETAAELVAGLALPSDTHETHAVFKAILSELRKFNDDVKVFSANKIYVGAGVQLENSFKDIASSIYHSGVENVDFAQSFEAAKTINDWVENNTNHKIHDIVDPNDIDASTRMILINNLYVTGKWENTFDTARTKKKNFYKSEKDQVEVDTMKQVAFFNYYENPELDAKFLELPYLDTELSMVIVLPNKRDGLGSLEEHTDVVLFERQEYVRTRVDIELPKFTIESKIDFTPILQNLNIKKAFQADADFSGISSTDKNLFITQIFQKAFINVTESGTEAAAATTVEISRMSGGRQLPVEATFHANHPFFYFIKGGDLIFFAGRYYS